MMRESATIENGTMEVALNILDADWLNSDGPISDEDLEFSFNSCNQIKILHILRKKRENGGIGLALCRR